MAFHTNNLAIRIGATVTGVCYGIVGGFSLYMSGRAPNAELADRAFWMGVTFLVACALALGVSWLVKDLSNIWCIPAKKTKYPRLGDDR